MFYIFLHSFMLQYVQQLELDWEDLGFISLNWEAFHNITSQFNLPHRVAVHKITPFFFQCYRTL